MGRQWEQYSFENRNGSPRVLQATLNKRGWILFNQHTWQELGLPGEVVLLFDRRTGTIGVRGAGPLDKHTLKVVETSKVGNRLVRANSFCRELNVLPTRTVRFTAPTIENGVLVLDLTMTRPLSGGSEFRGKAGKNLVFEIEGASRFRSRF